MGAVSGAIYLKPGREKPVANGHPWIFSGAVRRVADDPEPGSLVDVYASDESWLAQAYYNPHSQIRARVLSRDADDVIDEAWWRRRLQRAISLRQRLDLEPATTAYRLVNAEADRLPGLVVDRYGDFLVVQALTTGIERRKSLLVELLKELLQPVGIVERSDVDVRKKEGLKQASGLLAGEAPPTDLLVLENSLSFSADLLHGHKTGLYLDQRENRALLGQPRFVQDREVLNVFSYTGGFALFAASGGARRIANIDSSADALQQARENVQRRFTKRGQDEYVEADAFQQLRRYRDSGRHFDVVILDPPKFAHSKRDVHSATRGYKDLNWLAFRLLRPGGILATFSCSGLVSADLFQKVVFSAVIDAGRDAQIIHYLTQAADHPVLLTFPESAYLKGFLLRVI
ncbi:MAG TPA: class I SAM-dependent rRNA methyltransferase [Candidatus Sulfomarinibacteraceae bacterium]|nr:class I SAM-dependent rRNA methyltransferase [Candidatus Sulfomarinibacteraceae bacterium]